MGLKFTWVVAPFMAFLTLSCANGKKIKENPSFMLESGYYSSWTGGVKGSGSGYTFFIPADPGPQIVLDSVYFKGRKAVIEKSGASPNLYVAYFKVPSEEAQAPDIIMHADPRREYGNEPPRIPEKVPFELKEGEAMVRYTDKGKVKYFRLTGIRQVDIGDVKIKTPENIRH